MSSGLLAAVYSVFCGDVKQLRSNNKKIFMLFKNIFMVFDLSVKYAIVASKLIRWHGIWSRYRSGTENAEDRKTDVLERLSDKSEHDTARKFFHSDTAPYIPARNVHAFLSHRCLFVQPVLSFPLPHSKEQHFLAFARPLFEKGVWVPLPPFLVEKRLEMWFMSRLK